MEQRREIRNALYFTEDDNMKQKYRNEIATIENKLLALGVSVNGESNVNSIDTASLPSYPSFSMFEQIYDITQYSTTRQVNGLTYTACIVEVEDNGTGNGLIRRTYENDYVVKGKITNEYTASYFLESAISFGIDMAVSSIDAPPVASYVVSTLISSVVPTSEPYKLLTGTDVCVLQQTVVDEYARFVYVYDESDWKYAGCTNYAIQYALLSFTYLSGENVKQYAKTMTTYQNHSSSGTYISSITDIVNNYVVQKALGNTTPLDLRMSYSKVNFSENTGSGTTEREITKFPTKTPLYPGMLPFNIYNGE